jgi:hypothetical protein
MDNVSTFLAVLSFVALTVMYWCTVHQLARTIQIWATGIVWMSLVEARCAAGVVMSTHPWTA